MTAPSILSDLAIAQAAEMKPIMSLAQSLGLEEDELEPYGRYKAKLDLKILQRLHYKPNGKYILITAITPTPLGEGKTVTTIGLSQALAQLGESVCTTLRQPSLGPVFGIKGGAAGGGYAQVLPMEDFNLHLTGDTHAVAIAHNLLAAFLDAQLLHGNKLDLDILSLNWNRVVDCNDRALRHIIVGLGGKENGMPRESSFDIVAASEVMAILALAQDLQDLRLRLGKILVGFNHAGKAVTAEELKAAGAMAALLKDAVKPNLLQTLEHTPVLVHAGPFANIAHGNNSIIADYIALKLADYVVTESGFGADCGGEKFMDIKCRYSGLAPDCVVLVASIRALKMHGGLGKIVAGKPLSAELQQENLPALLAGCSNLSTQIANMKQFGVPVVVAINKFPTDTPAEIALVRTQAENAGAEGAFLSEVWAHGGAGGRDLAQAVVKACAQPNNFQFLYPLDAPIKAKIETIATRIYGAKNVEYSALAEKKLKTYTALGWDRLPICMAKTHLSLSHEPSWKGSPSGFTLPIRDIKASLGAGFLYPLCGEMRTMPGLPSIPAGTKIDIDPQGKITGLF